MQFLDETLQGRVRLATQGDAEADRVSRTGAAALPLHNQLEPKSLIDAFKRHPPKAFEILDGASGRAPAFTAPFDLLTTADESLRRRVRELPFYRHWSGLLRPRVAFVGTTVSEYAVLSREEPVRELPSRWKAAWGPRFPLLIVKDLPQNSPLLSEIENRLAAELADECLRQDYLLLDGQALAYVALDFDDLSTYLGRLSKSRQRDLRRKMRSLASVDVVQLPTGDPRFSDDRTIDRYFALYLSVFAQSKTQFDLLSREFFAAILRAPDSGGVVFEYRSRSADKPLVGWNLCFVTGGKLIDKYVGFDYPAARELNLYFVSWMINLDFAIKARLTHYVAGWSDPEVKAQLGAQFTFTRHAVYTRHELVRAAARRLSPSLESDRERIQRWT